MKTVLHLPKKERGGFILLCRLVMPPVSTRLVTYGSLSVAVCTLNPLWKPLFPRLIQHISHNREGLLLDNSMKQYASLLKQPGKEELFFSRFPELLKLCCESFVCYPTVICHQPDTRISTVLKALSNHAKAVTVVTNDDLFFDRIAKDAMLFLGLSLNQRDLDSVESSDLTVVLSVNHDTKIPGNRVISLCETEFSADGQILEDFSSHSTTGFFSSFPHLRLNHCFLVPETESIQNLIWKISKKS